MSANADLLLERYAQLRREGYDEFGAGLELGLRIGEAREFERSYKAAARRYGPPAGRNRPYQYLGPSAPAHKGSEAVTFSEDADERYVRAVLAKGGYPRGSGHGWLGPDGKRWRAPSTRKATA